MSVLELLQQLKVQCALLALEQAPLAISRAREQMLVVVRKLKLHDSQLVASETARWHRSLPLGHIPDNNVSVLDLLSLASTRRDITLVT